jgi:hypothetical protein
LRALLQAILLFWHACRTVRYLSRGAVARFGIRRVGKGPLDLFSRYRPFVPTGQGGRLWLSLAYTLTRVPLDEIEHIGLLVADAAADFYIPAAGTRRSLAFNGSLRAPAKMCVFALCEQKIQ